VTDNGTVQPIKPMLVTSGPLRPDSDRYAFEVKWDGFRSLIQARPKGVTVWSRNGFDMTTRYPELQKLSGAVECSVVLDGEIVVLDDLGKPDFAGLWFRSRGSSDSRVCFMAFDVLEVGDKSLLDLSLQERRKSLEALELKGPNWCTPENHIGERAALFAATKKLGLEGVVAKRLDSRYRPGLRSRSWTKTKHFQTRTFALLGWLPPQEWRGD
jgi:bifunctional non-homologous end joining protein LigD